MTMASKKDRFVSPRPNGWADQRVGSERATRIYPTQQEAIDAARSTLRQTGGGELNIQGEDRRIRQKDTVPPARDPFPPHDKK
jgi:hypothetical protein